jgi:hypothetical protein
MRTKKRVTYAISSLKYGGLYAWLELHATKDAHNVFVLERRHTLELVFYQGSGNFAVASLQNDTVPLIPAMLKNASIVRTKCCAHSDGVC